jgi:predicted MFS family arabinose efflux permease
VSAVAQATPFSAINQEFPMASLTCTVSGPLACPVAKTMPQASENAPLYWLALGAFAVGTENFMIAGLLPGMATDLSVSIAIAGQLVTAFSFAYAFSSPILTTLTGSLNRRWLLILAMSAFSLANVVAWAAPNYWSLMVARILLAFAAGLYVPGANALAGVVVRPEHRGRALAIVNGGLSLAIVFGVPLGTLLGHSLGWRMTFAGVAVLSAVATAGLVFGLPRGIGANLPVASLRERLATARRPVVLFTLLVTTLWAMGGYTVYTYLAPFMAGATRINGAEIGIVLFTWGVAAASGVFIGGFSVDKFGYRSVLVPALIILILAFLTLSLSAHFLPPSTALVPVFAAIVAWGAAAWAFYPAQQAGLIGIAGRGTASIALSLNASFMYLGFSLGAALGSLTLTYGSVANLGWAAATCEVVALALTLVLSRRVAAQSTAAV